MRGALAQWTAHNREHIVLLRPGPYGLVLHTLYYHDEVRAREEFRTDTSQIPARELELATRLVDSLAAPFQPAKYRDRYRENLRALIDAKIRGLEVAEGKPEPGLVPVGNLLEALQASLARAKKPVSVSGAVTAMPAAEHAVPAGPRRKRA